MCEECTLCYDIKNNYKKCSCSKIVCEGCYKKIHECPFCKNKNFGDKDPQKRAEEFSVYFREENTNAGLLEAIRLHQELNGIDSDSDDEMPDLIEIEESDDDNTGTISGGETSRSEEEEKEEENFSEFTNDLFLPMNEETQLQLILALSLANDEITA